jgi:hypothetical protein
MGDEHNFAMPPADEPILMGPPPTEDDAVFVGDVDTTGGAVEDTAAVMVPAPEDAGAEPVEDIIPEAAPVEPTGPTPMSIWNDEWQISLKERKDEETAKKAEILKQAKIDLEKFQAAREVKRETRMANNRSDEQQKLEAIEADLENDNSWQKVCKLVELSGDSISEAADTKRMRDVMIQLKNEPSRAEVLSN